MNEKWQKARRFSHIDMSSSNNFTYAFQYLSASVLKILGFEQIVSNNENTAAYSLEIVC